MGALLLAGSIIVRAGVLDGTKLRVKVVPDKAAAEKGAKPFDDELIFADGKCTSTTLSRQGFKPSKYNAEVEPNEAEFEIELVSATNGVVVWTGEIRGTNTLGGLQWMHEGRSNIMYEFHGTKEFCGVELLLRRPLTGTRNVTKHMHEHRLSRFSWPLRMAQQVADGRRAIPPEIF